MRSEVSQGLVVIRGRHRGDVCSSHGRELDEGGSDSAGGSGDQNPLGGNAGTLQQPLCRGVSTGEGRELAIGQGALDAKRFT